MNCGSRTLVAWVLLPDLGLTPRHYQSGKMDRAGHISRCGDAMLRTYLYKAANVMLRRSTRPCPLSVWGRALAERIGARKALVATQARRGAAQHVARSHRVPLRAGRRMTGGSRMNPAPGRGRPSSLPGRAPATASFLLQPLTGGLRSGLRSDSVRTASGHGGAALLTRCCGRSDKRTARRTVDPAGTDRLRNGRRMRRYQDRALVRCCLSGTTTSSLALRATAKGGCGLDPAVPGRPLASKASTPGSADDVGILGTRGEKHLRAELRFENGGTAWRRAEVHTRCRPRHDRVPATDEPVAATTSRTPPAAAPTVQPCSVIDSGRS